MELVFVITDSKDTSVNLSLVKMIVTNEESVKTVFVSVIKDLEEMIAGSVTCFMVLSKVTM
jgi:hypothetical protein